MLVALLVGHWRLRLSDLEHVEAGGIEGFVELGLELDGADQQEIVYLFEVRRQLRLHLRLLCLDLHVESDRLNARYDVIYRRQLVFTFDFGKVL